MNEHDSPINAMSDQAGEDREFSYEQEGGDSPDVPEIHRDIIQEQYEPHEGNERVPVWMFLVFIGLAMWGGWYVSEFDGEFRSDIYDGPDAFRVTDYSQPGSPKKPLDPEKLGKRVFNTCITCHQANGEGIVGKYPPLNQSEWVQGDDRILARILLNGLDGPIEVRGQKFNNQMPAWKQLSDYDIAAVLTHVRQSWDNDLPSVAPSTITAVREEIASETAAFKPEDLKAMELPEATPIGEEEIYLEYKNAGDIATMAEIDEDKWIKNLKEAYVTEKLIAAAGGDVEKGSMLFITATCITCHVENESSKAIAPSLDGISKRAKREEIVDSILHPSSKIAEGFEAVKFIVDMEEGESLVTGSILEENDEIIRLKLTSGEVIEFDPFDVLERMKGEISPMPIGLLDTLTIEQTTDLLAYLDSLEAPEGEAGVTAEESKDEEVKDEEGASSDASDESQANEKPEE